MSSADLSTVVVIGEWIQFAIYDGRADNWPNRLNRSPNSFCFESWDSHSFWLNIAGRCKAALTPSNFDNPFDKY